MSIEIDNPQTTLGKVDAAANLLEQMQLAHAMSDEQHFMNTKRKASILLHEATVLIENNSLAKLVKEMRTAQKNYFKTRKKSFLFQSKDLEKKVDELLNTLN